MRFSLVLALCVGSAFAQSPTFEVATIKPAPPLNPQMILAGKMRIGMKVDAGRVDIGFSSLRDLIVMAYEVKPFQVTGPDWMTAERWDVSAKIPEGAAKAQVPAMLRALLEERFLLKTHRESKDQNVYLLEQGKSGHKLKAAEPVDSRPAEPAATSDRSAIMVGAGDDTVKVTRGQGGGAAGGTISISSGRMGAAKMEMGQDGQMHMNFERLAMGDFATMLSGMVDRIVVDRTELNGQWQVTLDMAMQDMMQMARGAAVMVGAPGGAMSAGPMGPGRGALSGSTSAGGLEPADPSGGSVFSSVEKLGLKLNKSRAPLEMVVVDSAEKKPTEN